MQFFPSEKLYVLSGKSGKAANDQFNTLESALTWKLHELGGTRVSPESLGIPKP